MATVAENSADLAVPEWGPSQAVDEKIDRYLAARLKAVGADYRSVAITTFLLASAIGLVLWLSAGVVADHWLVPGGLGRTLRVAWLGAAAVALLAAAIRWVVPLVRYRVNLVYAARSIERANPELRNDVVNTVLVRARPDRVPAVVVTSLEHRAAKRLSKLPVDLVADRGPALRLAVVLAMLVAVACLYAVLSPKSIATSLARLAAPWSHVAPPTRVRIGEPEFGWRLPSVEGGGRESFHPIPVKDGRATIVRNRQLVVRSRIGGMAAGEEPVVEASGIADDGSVERSTGWRSRMEPASASAADGGFEASLPGGGHGLSSDLFVTVTAGDARSELVRIVVVDAPSLLVKQVKLVPPAYTRREPEILEWQGDVSGLEGTKVTLLAESKDPLEMAAIDFGCNGQGLMKMRIDPRDLARASGSFELRLSGDRSGPWERVYQLVFRPQGAPDGDGRERGIEHRINVVADTMPEVRVVEPAKPVVKVPPDKPVAVGVEAVDPDFALKNVSIELELERNGERMPRPAQAILDREFAGPFRGHAVFKPASVGGQAGDRLHYRAVAIDSKSPSPNAARTEWFTFDLDAGAAPRPVPPAGKRDDGQQQRGRQGEGQGGADDSKAQGGGAGGQADGAGGEAASDGANQGAGDRGDGPPEKGGQGDRSQGGGGSADGSSDPSEQASGSGGEKDSSRGGESSGKGGAGKGGSEGSRHDGERGEGAEGGGEAGAGQRGDGQKNAGQSDGKQGDRKQHGGEQGGGEQGGGEQGGGEQGGGEQSGGKQSGGKQGGGKQGGGKGSSRQETGEGEASDSETDAGDVAGAGKNADGRGNGERQASQKGDGQRSQGGEAGSEKPVASDGTNDGEAIERILENRASGERGGNDSGEKNSGGEKSGQQGDGNQGDGREGKNAAKNGGSSSGGGASGGNDGPQKDGSKKPGAGESGSGQPADDGGETSSQPGGEQGGKKTGETSKPGEGASRGDREGQNGSAAGSGSEGSGAEGKASSAEGSGADRKPGGGSNSQGKDGSPSQGDGASQGSGSQENSPQKSSGGKPGDSDVGRAGEDLANDDAASERKPSEQAGAGGRSGRGIGGATAGAGGEKPEGQAASKEADWGEENISHARNAVDLAVEHLERSLDEGRSDVLDSLGWTREQAQAFLERWTRMARDAKEGGPRKQRDFDRAVRSLGLTPGGVRRSRETVEQSRGNQAEGRRSQPPPEYREQFRAFSQGVRSDGG